MVSPEQMSAMTTNERLFEAGLMADFDKAVQERNADRVRKILKSIFVDDPSIDLIISEFNLQH